MIRRLLFLFVMGICFFHAHAQHAPKREMRGAWIATYANIDWPSRTQTPAQQQAALRTILDHHQATGINTIYLQVRSQCDAMYQSTIDPWSADLTGTQGRAPNPLWDPRSMPLTNVVKEAWSCMPGSTPTGPLPMSTSWLLFHPTT